MNQIHNQDRDPRGRRYIDEVKKFVLTLNFYSPRAHEYIRGVFSLPHTNLTLFVVRCHEYLSHLCYNHSAGNHDGYASYGKGIVAPEDDVVAKEVLVFMLVSF